MSRLHTRHRRLFEVAPAQLRDLGAWKVKHFSIQREMDREEGSSFLWRSERETRTTSLCGFWRSRNFLADFCQNSFGQSQAKIFPMFSQSKKMVLQPALLYRVVSAAVIMAYSTDNRNVRARAQEESSCADHGLLQEK